MSTQALRVIRLTCENFKRLKAVEITPTGDVVVISGKNDEGKTSVLDSIMIALAGAKSIPCKPIHEGAEKAEITLDLGEFIVKRTCTHAGNYLSVTNKEGFAAKSPQQILDTLIGSLSFDPLEFMRMEGPKQLAILKQITGLDFTALDKEYKTAYDERAALNREVKALEGQLAGLPVVEAPSLEVSIAQLSKEYQDLTEKKADNDKERENLKTLKNRYDSIISMQKDTELRIAEVKKQLSALEEDRINFDKELDDLKQRGIAQQAKVKALVDPDYEPIKKQMSEADETNKKVRQNARRAEVAQSLTAKKAEVDKLDKTLERITTDKQTQLTASKMPIPGLAFGEDGITYQGIPFKNDQISASARIKISLAIGLALNPRVRVILIRDGSLLDSGNMAIIAEMAKAASAQIWVERVADGEGTGIIIEDGCVQGSKKDGKK